MSLSCRYVVVYFTLLSFRKQKGIVTKEMLEVPKKQFLGIGAIEALSSVTGFISAAKLPGKGSCWQSAGALVQVLIGLAMRASCTMPLFLTPGVGNFFASSFHHEACSMAYPATKLPSLWVICNLRAETTTFTLTSACFFTPHLLTPCFCHSQLRLNLWLLQVLLCHCCSSPLCSGSSV